MPISAKGLTELEVLVVDDDPDSRDLIVFVLEEDGAKVTAVSSALEALQALQQDKFSLLISDIGMPQMDGYMLMQEIRSWTPESGGQIQGSLSLLTLVKAISNKLWLWDINAILLNRLTR